MSTVDKVILNLMTKDERSLLIFFETCLVDEWGRVDTRHMNSLDMTIAEKFSKSGLINFGRLKFSVIDRSAGNKKRPTHWVRFSDEAWTLAHKLRKERSARILKKHYTKLEKEKVK